MAKPPPLRILIVDDDQAFCDSLERVLAAHGCDVQAATLVEEAMAIFQRRPRGIVVLDMR